MKRFAMAILLTALSFQQGQAQDVWSVQPQLGYGLGDNYGLDLGSGWGYGYGLGIGLGYGFGGASTPASAAGHAEADIIRSEGIYNANTAAAMVNVEEARAKYIQNQRQLAELYLLKQRNRELSHAKAIETGRARNARYLEYQDTHRYADFPPRLESRQFDRSTGKVTWPAALMHDSFAPQRNEMESLLAARARSGATSELSAQITSTTRALHEQLRSQIRQTVTQDYLEAYKFLSSLSLEGRFPTG